MKFTINLRNLKDISIIQILPFSDVLVQTQQFCRSGGIVKDQTLSCIRQLKNYGKKVVLAWDCLAKDSEIETLAEDLEPLLADCDAVRFLDPGVGMFMKSRFPTINLEFSLEHGSLNLSAIQHWTELFRPQLSKVILSNQLPLTVIKLLKNQPPVRVEMLGYGPVEMFYSRRALLEEDFPNIQNKLHQLTIASEDRPNQQNAIIQTEKGVLVYYDKILNLFEYYNEIINSGIDFLRIEYLYTSELNTIAGVVNHSDWQYKFAAPGQGVSTKAFAQKNLSHKLFEKLTNKNLADEFDHKAGMVIEAVKNRYALIRLEKSVTLPQKIQIQSPEGKKIRLDLTKLSDLKGNNYTDIVRPGVYQMMWQKFVITGSLVTLVNKPSTQMAI